jgi:L-asparaginase
VADARLRRWQDWPMAGDPQQATRRLQKLLAAPRWPRVEWLTSHAGADGAVVRALLAQAASGGPALEGLVVAGTGNGTVHADLLAALAQARAAGVRVWRSTRCAYGSVLPAAGALVGDGPEPTDLPPAKARLSLMLALLGA